MLKRTCVSFLLLPLAALSAVACLDDGGDYESVVEGVDLATLPADQADGTAEAEFYPFLQETGELERTCWAVNPGGVCTPVPNPTQGLPFCCTQGSTCQQQPQPGNPSPGLNTASWCVYGWVYGLNGEQWTGIKDSTCAEFPFGWHPGADKKCSLTGDPKCCDAGAAVCTAGMTDPPACCSTASPSHNPGPDNTCNNADDIILPE